MPEQEEINQTVFNRFENHVQGEFKNIWDNLTEHRNITNANAQKIGIIERDVQGLTASAAKIETAIDQVLDKVQQHERPNFDLWIKIASLILVVFGFLWGLAISPLQNSITANNALQDANTNAEIMRNGYERKILEMRIKALEDAKNKP